MRLMSQPFGSAAWFRPRVAHETARDHIHRLAARCSRQRRRNLDPFERAAPRDRFTWNETRVEDHRLVAFGPDLNPPRPGVHFELRPELRRRSDDTCRRCQYCRPVAGVISRRSSPVVTSGSAYGSYGAAPRESSDVVAGIGQRVIAAAKKRRPRARAEPRARPASMVTPIPLRRSRHVRRVAAPSCSVRPRRGNHRVELRRHSRLFCAGARCFSAGGARRPLALLGAGGDWERQEQKNNEVTHGNYFPDGEKVGELRQVAIRGQLHIRGRHVADVTPGNHVQRSITGRHERRLRFPGRRRRLDGRLPRRHFNFDDARDRPFDDHDLRLRIFHRIRLHHVDDLRTAEPRPPLMVVSSMPWAAPRGFAPTAATASSPTPAPAGVPTPVCAAVPTAACGARLRGVVRRLAAGKNCVALRLRLATPTGTGRSRVCA